MHSTTRTMATNETKLLEPYVYISQLPGKGVRGKMIGAFQTWLCAPSDTVKSIQSIVDQLHNASLLYVACLQLLSSKGRPGCNCVYTYSIAIIDKKTMKCILFFDSIDDIEDDSEMRRGQPVAHHIFGIPATINCANYVYFLSLQECQALGNPQAMQVYTNEMLRLHRGQGLDIFWRDHLQCPTVDEYLEMVQNSECKMSIIGTSPVLGRT